jgi:hypothetical protein
MGTLWPTSNLKKKHLRGQWAGFSLCGMGRVGVLKFVHEPRKSTCGSCIAIKATAVPEQPVQAVGYQRQLYSDAGRMGPATVWECVEKSMFPLNDRGKRLDIDPHEVPEFETVRQMYGPLTKVEEIDIVWRYVHHLEDRVNSL